MNLLNRIASQRIYFVIAAALVGMDQITKLLAHGFLSTRGALEIIPGFFNLSYSRNAGGLFGYFGDWSSPWRTVLLTVLPVLAIGMIVWFLAHGDGEDRKTRFGLALILGGAVGNLIDRLFRGEVVDFLDVYLDSPRLADWLVAKFGTAHWPTFNLADSGIVVGACLLLLSILRPHAAARADSPKPSAAGGQQP